MAEVRFLVHGRRNVHVLCWLTQVNPDGNPGTHISCLKKISRPRPAKKHNQKNIFHTGNERVWIALPCQTMEPI